MSTPDQPIRKRKLIEVALPLETINREAAREKSIRQGHPSALHLWWARRPLAAARAVLFAQLVDDPSSLPDEFPSEAEQSAERERLHKMIEQLVVWENTGDQRLLDQAHREILKSTDGNPPSIFDPFAGGGTIPLEAQRLGLRVHASDLNPVAVLINKALIEIPPKFAGQQPVFPGLAESRMGWEGASGLARDVRAYIEWMRDEAEKRIGPLYPSATLADGGSAGVIAWIWARTVTCPNLACGIEMPLARSWWLSKKKGKEAWVKPVVVADSAAPGGRRIDLDIQHEPSGPNVDGTVTRGNAVCVACGAAIENAYIRLVANADGLGAKLISVVVDGNRQRVYLPADSEHAEAARVDAPMDVPTEFVTTPNHDVDRLPMYGMPRWCDAFTNRQLVALTTLSDLVAEARERVLADAREAGRPAGDRLEAGGNGAEAYADAVATYLGMVVSTATDDLSSLVSWRSSHGTGASRSTFARQALPMVWDYVELNPFGGSAGDIGITAHAVTVALERMPSAGSAVVVADDAARATATGLISTDPPYYDNIGYSDLSDFFYVWLRRSLREVHPELLATVLVPKADELVANPYRHGGKEGARRFFEDGFRQVFARARETASESFPITVYYAFKQADSGDDGTSSTGWETLLDGMIRSGWEITSTWPMRSERGGRMISVGTNALASSIVLSLRPRLVTAPTTDRRGLIAALRGELPDALRRLQQGAIAPVDLPQAAIGPGMAVFSRYARVIENDGSPMTVRSALARINEILDQVLAEQEGDFDPATRFAIAWYRQHGYSTGSFGDADNLARARNTAVEGLARAGILASLAGKVTLVSPARVPEEHDVLADEHLGVWAVLHHLISFLARDGVPAAGLFLANAGDHPEIDLELVKELAFLLFSIAEKNGWTQDAVSFNQVATSWPEIVDAARTAKTRGGPQATFQFEED